MKKLTFLLFFSVFLSTSICRAQGEFEHLIGRYLKKYYEETSTIKAYVHTDKQLYETGENVWYSVLAVDRFTHKPGGQEKNILLRLVDQKGAAVWEKLVTLKNGMAQGAIPLFEHIPENSYVLKAYDSQSSHELYSQTLIVREHVLPHHLVNAWFQKKYYGGGDKVTLHISATDYFKVPLRNADFECRLINGSRTEFVEKGKLDKSGEISLSFNLSNPISADPRLDLYLEDKNSSELLSFHIPVQSENIQVAFFPEGGSLTHGIETKVTVKAYKADGSNFPFSGVIFSEGGEKLAELNSDEHGVASFLFTPDDQEKVNLQVTSPYVVNKIFELPKVSAEGANLSLADIEGKNVHISIRQFPERERMYYLSVANNGSVLSMQKLSIQNEESLTLTSPGPGINRVTLFNHAMEPLSEVTVFVAGATPREVYAEFSSEAYNNRERVSLHLDASEPLFYAFSATDEFRLTDDRPNILSHLAVNSELTATRNLAPELFKNPEELSSEINYLLSFSVFQDSWKEIYEINGKKTDFQKDLPSLKKNRDFIPFNYQHNEQGYLFFSNFTEDVYYLANNPILIEELERQKKSAKKNEPYYREQLRNGVPLRDVIHNMKPYTLMGDKIVFAGTMNSLMAQGGALIVLDGVRLGESISVLDQINPFDIDEIFISTKPQDILNYTGLNSVGVIDIKTKRGTGPSKNKMKEFDEEFQSPDYSKGKDKNVAKDLRTTAYYAPVKEESSFPEEITFYHSDVRTKVVGRIEGMSEGGSVVYKEVFYESYNYSKENQ